MTLTESIPSNFAKRWTFEEDQILRANYGKKRYHEIAVMVDRTTWGVRKRSITLGLPPKRKPSHKRDFVILEKVVKAKLLKWLKAQGLTVFDEWKPSRSFIPRIDVHVKGNVFIECKGHQGSLSASFYLSYLIGQLLIYNYVYVNSKVYCAIPEQSTRMLERLKTILDYYNMPFGILIVTDQGVTVERDSYGFFKQLWAMKV